MPNPNRKTLLRALCLTAAGSALFASLYVGSTSAYFTSTATVQVADIRATDTWPNNPGQSDDPEADAPVFLDEETIAPDTVLAAAPTPAARTAEKPAATPSPTAEPVFSTIPTISCPTVIPGTARGTEPCLICKSLVQMLANVTRTSASRSSSKTGTGFSFRANLPGSR